MRRQPKQARSEESVERIKLAMRQIIEEQGYAAATTNEIAKRAGVNISSVYFFFPNREAIAQALYESTALKVARVAHQQVLENMTKPPEEGMANMVSVLIDAFDKEQLLLLKLVEQAPNLQASAKALAQEQLGQEVARLYFRYQVGSVDEDVLLRKTYLAQRLGFDLIRRYVIEKPAWLSKEQFIADLVQILTMYLKAAPKEINKNESQGRRKKA